MMAGAKWAQKIQLGRESTAGTAVAATTIWRGVGGMLKDNREINFVDEMIGIAIPTTRVYAGLTGSGLSMAATPATFEQLPHILEAGIKSVGTGVADGVGSGKIYAYPVGMTSANTVKTYTIETGDNQQAYEADYCFVEKFTLSGEKGQAVMMSADWVGRDMTTTTFTGALSAPTVEEILTGKGSFFIDAVSGTIGSTAVTETLLKWELSVTTGYRGKWTVDQGSMEFAFAYFDRDSFSAEFSATYEHNATTVSEYTDFRNSTPQLLQLKIVGDAVATPGTAYTYKTLIINMAATYTEWDALDAEDGNSIINVKARVGYDATAAKGLEIIVVNELATIP